MIPVRRLLFSSALILVSIVFSTARVAAEEIDVILEVELTPPADLGEPLTNVIGMYDSTFFGSPVTEQYFTGLQSKLFGHLRVRLDPENLSTIQFVGEGSYLTLSTGDTAVYSGVTEDSLAEPGGTPANMAAFTGNDGSVKVAFRETRLELTSDPIPLFQPDPLAPHLFAFDSQSIVGRITAGRMDFENFPFVEDGFVHIAGQSLGANLSANAGFFGWAPAVDPTSDQVAAAFDLYFDVQPFGSFVNVVLSGNLFDIEGKFSADNYRSVSTSGQIVELMGGADEPGGVTAMSQELLTEGTFVAQQIGLNGLPLGAIEAARSVPDLAYTLGLSSYTAPIWNLDFTGEAAAFDVTLGYDDSLIGDINEGRLVLYHYNDAGEWEVVSGQNLNSQFDTVSMLLPSLSPFMLAVAVPEPSSFVLAAIGTAGVVCFAGRKRKLRRG